MKRYEYAVTRIVGPPPPGGLGLPYSPPGDGWRLHSFVVNERDQHGQTIATFYFSWEREVES